MREFNFDGLVGPTHNYAGLSPGNLASSAHRGQRANPRRAALQGLGKMRFVASLGVGQAVLPPHERPRLRVLRALGFHGSDEQVIAAAAQEEALGDPLLRLSSSAAAMWTANAATCIPSQDSADRRLHFVPANLAALFHRAIEADETARILRAIFADAQRFQVHDPLPGVAFSDEGAANHLRLHLPERPAVHVFAWGKRAFPGADPLEGPRRHRARQALEASRALARLGQIDPARALFPQQDPRGIDAGAFHTDVLAVGAGRVLLLHELAFVDPDGVVARLRGLLGDGLVVLVAREAELPVAEAVAAYPFNSQLLVLPEGSMCIVAPEESHDNARARAYLERVIAESGAVGKVHYLPLRDSMENGGGPACLRLRIALEEEEAAAVGARVFFDDALASELEAWVGRHYRDRLEADDLRDPALARESMAALDELSRILRLGSVYDFQR